MKLTPETKPLSTDNNKVEIVAKKKQEIERRLAGTIKPKAGQKIWEINEETGVIQEAKYTRQTDISISTTGKVIKPVERLIVSDNCVYIPALNMENAKKQYLKNKEQSFYYVKPAPMSLNGITMSSNELGSDH